ncbi:hypothetical protein SAMN05518866_102168 [Sphingobium sp. YR768]|nr:hypothetical protein SAMN05518866_102168 [Sphingobium sp. YR768]
MSSAVSYDQKIELTTAQARAGAHVTKPRKVGKVGALGKVVAE